MEIPAALPEIVHLREAWRAAPPPPDLRQHLTPDLLADERRLGGLIHLDAIERHGSGEDATLEHYRALLPENQAARYLAPGSELARRLIRLELLTAVASGGDASARIDAVRARLGSAYSTDVHFAVLGAAPSMERVADGRTETLNDAASRTCNRPPALHLPADAQLGKWIGRYRLLDVIGEGGFGIVYHVEQREPFERQFALKLIKPGMDTHSVLARFESERQMLALLRHENIAGIYDGGITEQGRPYFVMELVHGEPITQYCDRHRLTLQERLQLFIPVCRAVHHAHQKGLINRDLSPDNILVEVRDGKAIPKIIDFGVARAIDRRLTQFTLSIERGIMIGKPEYMSPEQAEMNNLDIDTTADVYSLGVILYELIAGVLPLEDRTLRQRAMDEMVRLIRFGERPTPDTRLRGLDAARAQQIAFLRQMEIRALTAELAGRVQHLPMKALRPDRTKRFSSAEAMARDVENYLANKDFEEAAEEPWQERLIRLVWRNRGPVAAAAALLLVLSLGILGTTVGLVAAARVAEGEREARAEAEERRLEAETARIAAESSRVVAEDARIAAQYDFYIANLMAADAAISAGEWSLARARLNACPEHLRGWEWDYWSRRGDNSLRTFGGHEAAVATATFTPDGTRVLTGLEDGRAKLWNVESGELIMGFVGHNDEISAVAFSPDATQLVTASYDGTARIWNVVTGQEVASLHGHSDSIESVAFDARGTRFVTTSFDGFARVWDSASGVEIAGFEHDESGVQSAVFSPDGRHVLTTSLSSSHLWNIATGEEVATFTSEVPVVIHGAAFSPDGSRIVTGSLAGPAHLWDVRTGEGISVLAGHTQGTHSIAYSPAGNHIVTASMDGTARLWDGETGQELAVLRGHRRWVLSASFSHDGQRIITASMDGTARIWNVETGEEIATLRGHEDGVIEASFNIDGTRALTTSSDGTARLWDGSSNDDATILRGHAGQVRTAAFSRDGTRVVTSSMDGTARLWDVLTGDELFILSGHEDKVVSAAFSPCGTRIVTASLDHTARVWDAVTGHQMVILRGHESGLHHAAFSHDGSIIATASFDGTARLFDAGSGAPRSTLRGHAGSIASLIFSDDGRRIVTASSDETARVWDVANASTIAILSGHEGGALNAAISPDGTRVVTTSHHGPARLWNLTTGDGGIVLGDDWAASAAFSPDGLCVVTASSDSTAELWDASTGASKGMLRGHDGAVRFAAFSPDGSRIVTASEDGTARIWDRNQGVELVALRGHEQIVECAAFSPDGTRIVTASWDNTVRIWDAGPYRERLPAVEAMRRARLKMAPLVRFRLDSGEAPEDIARSIATDPELSVEERTAALAELNVLRKEHTRAESVERTSR